MLMRIIIIQLSGFRFLKCKSLNSLSTDFVNYGNDSNFVRSLAIVFLFINKLCQTSVAGSDLTPWRRRGRRDLKGEELLGGGGGRDLSLGLKRQVLGHIWAGFVLLCNPWFQESKRQPLVRN